MDESVPEHRDAPASSSRESDPEPREKWYRASTVFLLTSRRTEIATSARGPKLQWLLAENALIQCCLEDFFGDLITADHKVLSEGCESRNNHRYVVVEHDLATLWIQSCQCKTKTS